MRLTSMHRHHLVLSLALSFLVGPGILVGVTGCSDDPSPPLGDGGADAARDVRSEGTHVDQHPTDAGRDGHKDISPQVDADHHDSRPSDGGQPDAHVGPLFAWDIPSAATVNAWQKHPPTCDVHDWLRKYFYYRARLRGNGTAAFPGFVSSGTAAGESLLASSRDATAHCESDWWLNDASCTRITDPKADGKYVWGDTTIWEGWYIAWLATEDAVFRQVGADLTQVEHDLQLALAAFDRLDLAAEIPYAKPGKLDGFFVRTDTPADFIYKGGAGHYRFPRSDNGLSGYGCIGSGPACAGHTIQDGFFVSQDQIIGMLSGLAMVVRLVPTGTVVNGKDLVETARDAAHRMVKHIRDHGWKITDPDGNHPPDAWGGNALSFSNQIAKAANLIVQGKRGVADYRNLVSRTAGQGIFTGLDLSWNLQTDVNKSMAIKLVSMSNDWTQEKFDQRALEWNSTIFPLIYALLQNKPTVSSALALWELESILDSAPCSGPCDNTPGCTNVPGWRGESRWSSPEARNGDRNYPKKEMNGVDYLIAHNLYFLYTQGKLRFALPKPPANGCPAQSALTRITTTGPTLYEVYDPFDPCNAADLGKRFCGRTWARWLEQARMGAITITTGTARWLLRADGRFSLMKAPLSGEGTSGDDLILGTAIGDQLSGLEGQDCIYGLAGTDTLDGGAGRDELHGGDGNDVLKGDGATPATEDHDLLFGEAGDDTLAGNGGDDTLVGGIGADTLDGGDGNDYLGGDADNDVCRGGNGEDFIEGGDGDDELHGGGGDDVLRSGEGRDKLAGDGGSDDLRGAGGNDFLDGGAGNDTLWAGAGNDRLCGGTGDDHLGGGSGHDTCRATDPGDTKQECDAVASAADCSAAAFAAW